MRIILRTALVASVLGACLPSAWAGRMEAVIDAAAKKGTTNSPGLAVKEVYQRQNLFRASLVNDAGTPGEAVAKIVGLAAAQSGTYDVYVDRKLIGALSPEDLAEGIRASLSPAIVARADVDFVRRVDGNCLEVVELLKGYSRGDGKLVRDLCNQVDGWCRLFINQEERSRSTEMFLSPTGEPPAKYPPNTKMDRDRLAAARDKLFRDIAGVRRLLANKLVDGYMSGLAAQTLAPSDFAVKDLPPPCAGCRKVLATLTNRADKAMTVKLSIAPAEGVAAKPTGKTEAVLERGQSLSCGFVLTGAVKKDAVEKYSYALARVTLDRSAYTAREKAEE